VDTQDLVDTLKTWTNIYRQNRDPVLDYPPSKDPDELKWEEDMLRIAAVIFPADSITGTPAFGKIDAAGSIARSKDRSKLKDIYILYHEVEEYLKESLV
jgi:hypothetical protein